MSIAPEDAEKLTVLIMEEEVKIAGAEHMKKSIELRILKRRSEIKRDEEHIILQDRVITQAKSEIERMKGTINGGQ